MKKSLSICFALCLSLFTLVLCGCQEPLVPYSLAADQPVSLWVVTEETTADGMNHQAKTLIEQFITHYPNVEINLDILPSAEPERTVYLEEIRGKMDSGDGPDIFLLPTSDVVTLDHPQKYTYQKVTPLIPDVNQAMQEGYFLDISGYYDSDASLGKDALNTTVMDAGCTNGKRYLLPLRYSVPVMCVFHQEFDALGADISELEKGIDSWMAYLLEKDDPKLFQSGELTSLDAYADLIDYEKSEVILSQEQVSDYMRLYQQVQAKIGTKVDHRSRAMISSWLRGGWTPLPAQTVSLSYILDYIAIAEIEGYDLSIHPVPSSDGDYVANVTYYTAISADCAYSDYAYEFCRSFLLEESQWEHNRLKPAADQYWGLIERGWPVRTDGSVAALWENYKAQNSNLLDSGIRYGLKEAFLGLKLEDSMVPILEESVDIVRFPVPSLARSHGEMLAALNDFSSDNAPTDADMRTMAAEFVQLLKKSLP